MGSLLDYYSKKIEQELKKIGINYEVDPHVENSSDDRYNQGILVAEIGFSDDRIALLASSAHVECQGVPVWYVLIPTLFDNTLFVDKNSGSLSSNTFFVNDGKTIHPVKIRQPVPLRALNVDLESFPLAASDHHFVSGRSLQDITNSKLRTKRCLEKSRIKIADYVRLTKPLLYRNKLKRSGLMEGDFVVKADNGHGGNQVRMFTRRQLRAAQRYAQGLSIDYSPLLLERRVHALPWHDQKGRHLDWNIRAFVTFSTKPQWLDGLVRYSVKSGKPVNICQGAKVEEIPRVVKETGASLDDIISTALKATRVIAENCPPVEHRSYLGLDLLVASDGVYIIEINDSAAGGFAELCMMRQQPLTSVPVLLRHIAQYTPKPTLSSQPLYNPVHLEETELFTLSTVCIESGDFKNAARVYRRELRRAPQNTDALVGLIICLASEKRYDQVVRLFERKGGLLPPDNGVSYFVALSYYHEKRAIESERLLRPLVDSDPHEKRIEGTHFFLGKILYEQRNCQEALILVHRACRIDPSDAASFHLKGLILEELAEYTPARNSFKRAARLHPDDPSIWHGLARVCTRLLDFTQAETAFQRAVCLDPTNGHILYNAAQFYNRVGQPDQALDLYRTVALSFLYTINRPVADVDAFFRSTRLSPEEWCRQLIEFLSASPPVKDWKQKNHDTIVTLIKPALDIYNPSPYS